MFPRIIFLSLFVLCVLAALQTTADVETVVADTVVVPTAVPTATVPATETEVVSTAVAPTPVAPTATSSSLGICDAPFTIMPLGDSITRGYGTGTVPFQPDYNYGYRYYLYNSLTTAGYYFDFVGSLAHGDADGRVFDYDHEGHGGYRADQVAQHVVKYLADNPAEVLLLHIGTNDIAQGQGNSVDDVTAILDAVDSVDENVPVVLAAIIDQNPTDPRYQSVTLFNTNLTLMAQTRIANGDNLILVDMQSALAYPADMYDWLHPNDSGYSKMAEVWFDALQPLLPPCPAVITSTPVITAVINEPYSYDVQATGFPTPTFSFIATPPAGMTIDAATGVITWTPTADQAGAHEISVQAGNTFGSDTQTFTLTVETADRCLAPLVAYWPLNEIIGGNMVDDVVGNHDASCAGSCPASVAGRVSGALQFNGSNGLSVPDSPDFNWDSEESFTVQTWVQTAQACTGNQVFIGKFRAGDANHGDFWLGCGNDNNEAIFALRTPGGNSEVQGTAALNDGQWHHIVGVYDAAGDNIQVYVDGSSQGSTPTNFTGTLGNDEPLTIGYFGSAGYYFGGGLDEVAVHDLALTAVQVQQHYNNGLSGVGYCTAVVFTDFVYLPVILKQ